jgi:hypothetical protein
MEDGGSLGDETDEENDFRFWPWLLIHTEQQEPIV